MKKTTKQALTNFVNIVQHYLAMANPQGDCGEEIHAVCSDLRQALREEPDEDVR